MNNRYDILKLAVRAAELFIDIMEVILTWLAERKEESSPDGN